MKSQKGILTYVSNQISLAEAHTGALQPADRQLLSELCVETVNKLIAKFVNGAAKHGGSVLDRSGLNELEQELLDSVVYLKVARTQIHRI